MRRIPGDDETFAELAVLAGYDDLAGQSTRLTNRLRDAAARPSRLGTPTPGPRLDRVGILDLLAVALTPAALGELGARGMAEVMAPRSPRLAGTLPAQILTALAAQSLVVAGTAAFARVISGTGGQLRDAHDERADLAAELEARLEAHPLGPVLTTMPGVGVSTATKLLTIVGDGAAFPAAAHLAAYAGLAPVTRRSGSSSRGETRSQRGNHALKSALFLYAFAALGDPDSRRASDVPSGRGVAVAGVHVGDDGQLAGARLGPFVTTRPAPQGSDSPDDGWQGRVITVSGS